MNWLVGELRIFAGNFAPSGWNLCDGALLSIADHESLFMVIGTTYGGDGAETFALPDLRGRVPLHRDPTQDAPFSERGGGGVYAAPVGPTLQQPCLGLNYIIALTGAQPQR